MSAAIPTDSGLLKGLSNALWVAVLFALEDVTGDNLQLKLQRQNIWLVKKQTNKTTTQPMLRLCAS